MRDCGPPLRSLAPGRGPVGLVGTVCCARPAASPVPSHRSAPETFAPTPRAPPLRPRHTLAAAAILSVLAAPALAQDVKYEKYTLDNGMTVILHEDHSLPVAAVNIWYRVGAKEEPPGRSGFAHLFEHLMFMGTKRVPGNDFDIIMETSGGAKNASHSVDR